MTQVLFAPHAWLGGRWQRDVLLEVASDGTWQRIHADVAAPPRQATRLAGPILPGLTNAHSHAFQRAFAGLAEGLGPGGNDDFWSWRDRMYAVALSIDPDGLHQVAVRLYREMLAAGYTQVCEFHYLHRAPDGRPYTDRLAMARALCEAALEAGIGITMLPVLYERAGFGQQALRDDQRRFACDAEGVLEIRDGVRALGLTDVDAGVAIHSLRAARPESIAALADACASDRGPIHIHVAEQVREVDECIAHSGQRPVAWLAANVDLDARWQLVHATHVVPEEIASVGKRRAGAVLCPTTEANLGDGITDLPAWLASGAVLSIGSDSHVTRDWREELRLLEYGQRLVLRRRNVAADASHATAERLFERMLAGSGPAAGLAASGFTQGARADFAVVDPDDPALAGVPFERWLDALVFVSPGRPMLETWVRGRRVFQARGALATSP